MKVVTIVGARPQFVKAAVVSRAMASRAGLDERLVHTGQHYDPQMSQVFFDELGIPAPSYNLAVGSGPQGAQTGRMLERIEQVLLDEQPRAVLVYGDTNSTLAGALAACKLNIPVAHVEAGLRSFNMRMPEEVNRILTDRVSQLLFCPTQLAVDNLAAEGLRKGVHLVGDVMYDAAVCFSQSDTTADELLRTHNLGRRGYVLMTCHRAENTDDPARLRAIIGAAAEISTSVPVLFPVHPRTRSKLESLDTPRTLILTGPLSYLEMLAAERHARAILTDSGGVQKEAFIFGVPCVTCRGETEWPETLQDDANILADASSDRIARALQRQLERTTPIPDAAPLYGGGQASDRIAALLLSEFS